MNYILLSYNEYKKQNIIFIIFCFNSFKNKLFAKKS